MDELLRSLSDEQKQMTIFSIRDAYTHLLETNQKQKADYLINCLAEDESILSQLEEMHQQVYTKLRNEYGEANIMANHQGIYNMMPTQH